MFFNSIGAKLLKPRLFAVNVDDLLCPKSSLNCSQSVLDLDVMKRLVSITASSLPFLHFISSVITASSVKTVYSLTYDL